ncbi:hypothetical protein RF11_07926 [Thelohanellus kitauei]|uniref:Uncharacterized protein n=1 Tax=Thelohanellus kitauei TaxID=669202 RepID=A0A0C2NJW8_THEKT|nr:hypothetical protein RF11_07926 [Thelohanellus kitauei]
MLLKVVYLSIICVCSSAIDFVSSLGLAKQRHYPINARNSLLLTFSLLQFSKCPIMANCSTFKNGTPRGSYLGSSNLVGTRQDNPNRDTLRVVDLEKIKGEDEYCKLICLNFGPFPLQLDSGGDVLDADLAMFELHLRFVEFADTGKKLVLRVCNDPKEAPCMAEILKKAVTETVPDFFDEPFTGYETWVWIYIGIYSTLGLLLAVCIITCICKRKTTRHPLWTSIKK